MVCLKTCSPQHSYVYLLLVIANGVVIFIKYSIGYPIFLCSTFLLLKNLENKVFRNENLKHLSYYWCKTKKETSAKSDMFNGLINCVVSFIFYMYSGWCYLTFDC